MAENETEVVDVKPEDVIPFPASAVESPQPRAERLVVLMVEGDKVHVVRNDCASAFELLKVLETVHAGVMK